MHELDIAVLRVNCSATPPTVTVGTDRDPQTIGTTPDMCEQARLLLASHGHASATVRFAPSGEREIIAIK